MSNNNKILIITLLSTLSSHLLADNLLDIYKIAKDSDPTFLASDAGKMAASERVSQSMAALLPQIRATASYKVSNSEITTISNGTTTFVDPLIPPDDFSTIALDETDATESSYSILLSQEIYNHASWLNLRQSEKRALQSNVNHEGAKQDLIIRVTEAYFNVLGAQDDLTFSKSETEAVSKQLSQTKQRFEVGLIAMTDVHEAQSRYDRATANQIATQNSLDNSYESLQQITGQYHYNLLGLKKDIKLRAPQPEDIKQWAKKAENNNVNIQAFKIGLDIAKQSISISQAGHFPTLDLSASYNDFSSDTDSTSPNFNDNLVIIGNAVGNRDRSGPNSSIELSFNIPLFSGGRTNSQVNESQQLYLQAAHNLEAEHRRAISSTRSSYLGVIAAVGSVKALKQAVISSQSALNATQAGFEVGTRTIVDVLLQTQLLFDAKRQHARARYDYVLNTLKLKQAAGLLNEDDLKKVNSLLR